MSIKPIYLYDYDSFAKAENEVANLKFNDAQQGAFVRESLIHAKTTLHWYQPPESTILDLGLNVDNTGGYANAIKSKRRTAQGSYKKQGGSIDESKGVITLGGEESQLNVFGYSAESSYSLTESKQAQLEGENLYSSLLMAHQEKYIESIDEGGYGVLIDVNNGFERVDSPTPADGLTDVELSNTLRNLVINQRNNLNSQYHCDTIVMTPKLKLRCDSADYKPESGMSISSKLKQTLGITIKSSFRLTGVGAGGTDIVIALNTNPNALAIRIPMKFRTTPTWRTGDDFHFQTSFRSGGVDILELSAGYVLDKM